jgi:gluconokinase
VVIIIMGVVGAGKTTIGRLLADQLAWEFVDADSFHSPTNIEKMRSGKPLTDSDRIPWLDAIHAAITNWVSEKQDVVLACSALKRSYRLKMSGRGVVFVYLRGDPALVAQRLGSRTGHYATEQLLTSQLEALEEPEHAITVDVDTTPAEIVSEIRRRLALG